MGFNSVFKGLNFEALGFAIIMLVLSAYKTSFD